MNSFGNNFRVQVYGESHGNGVGVILDGVPPGISIGIRDFEADLNRRRSGRKGTTTRLEDDVPQLISGVFNGYTTGAPLNIFFENKNTISKDYSNLVQHPRPGHADFVANEKFKGFQDYRGGGHFSGRLTLSLVSAGVVAKKILSQMSFHAELIEAGGSQNIEKSIEVAMDRKDSIGGIVECKVEGVPVGLGEPFFDSVESKIAHLAFAIPAIKGIEFGAGFNATKMTGAEHNDPIVDKSGKTATNHAGGINGGLSNGNEIVFRIAVKPTSSISKSQNTYNSAEKEVQELTIVGRHDVCIALRVPVVCEAIAAIALADFSR